MPAKISITSSIVATATAETTMTIIVFVVLFVLSLLSRVGTSFAFHRAVTTALYKSSTSAELSPAFIALNGMSTGRNISSTAWRGTPI